MNYKVQINDTIRNATPEEIVAIQQLKEDARTEAASVSAIAAAKVSARTKLAALGLTDAEITALLGV